MKKKKLIHDDEELERIGKNNSFHRKQTLKKVINWTFCIAIPAMPIFLIILIILNLYRPNWISNIYLLDRLTWGLATGIGGYLLAKVKAAEDSP